MPTPEPTRSRWTPRWPAAVASRPRSDDELLLAAGAGDRQAFATLYDRIIGPVYTDIWSALHDTARADAVAEDVFIEVWRQAAWFDPSRATALMWVLDVAHRLAAGPARPVSSALAELTEPQQRAIELAVGGCTQDDIADQLDTPPASVQALLRGGLLSLRSAFQPSLDAADAD